MTTPGEPTTDNQRFEPLVVTVVPGRDRVTVVPDGEVDPATVDRLAEALDRAADTGLPVIEVDCSQLRFLDSAGVNLLATRHRRHEQGEGPRVVVTNATGIVARVLEVSGVAERLSGTT